MAISDSDVYECANDDCAKVFRHGELVKVSERVSHGIRITQMGCPHCQCTDYYIVQSGEVV